MAFVFGLLGLSADWIKLVDASATVDFKFCMLQ